MADAVTPSAKPFEKTVPIGLFQPNWESLAQYKAPEWFQDAKFGIWAVWSPNSIPEQGDWYAQNMYQNKVKATGQPHRMYAYHVTHYGHPSKFGFKDVINTWHAERWEPEKLITLYKKAGAQYFVALANFCDNFDLWDSKYQSWNSVRLGPKRDIIGGWARAARSAGLPFGVSVHASHAWMWNEASQGADTEGPMAGVPYDGKLTKADGKGQWWEGLDPQDLYEQNHKPGTSDNWEWDAKKGCSIPDKAYCERFYNRSIDLIDRYKPDLLYFDDTVLPLWPISDVGLKIAAHYYNASIQSHGGRNEAVLTGKLLNKEQQKCMVRDIERGKAERIEPSVWQTDTCIGDWHYARWIFNAHSCKKASDVVPMLVDIVSKNGNLLLNIPVRGDGSLDEDETALLEKLARWMAANREGILATRPWKIYGEGPSTAADNSKGYIEGQSDVSKSPFTAQDFRFTVSKDGAVLYAIALGWPVDGKLVIKSLANNALNYFGEIRSVELLGSMETCRFTRDETALTVTVPLQKPCEYAYVLKISKISETKPRQ